MKKRIIALLCLLAMSIAMVASGCQGKVVAYERGTPVEYYSVQWRGIDEDEFFISAFIGPHEFYAANGYTLPSLMTEETFAKLQEAGVNHIWESTFDADSEMAEKALTLSSKYNINYSLPCDSVLYTDFTDSNKYPEDGDRFY